MCKLSILKQSKASNFWKRAVVCRQCTFHSVSDDVRLIHGEAHALRTNTTQNVKRVYVKSLRKMKSGLEKEDTNFPLIS